MNRRVKSPDETRRKLLDAGLRVFGTISFGSAKLENIAVEAGMTRGAISWHFKNKKALFREMLKDFSTEKFNAVLGIYNCGEPPMKILEMLIEYHMKRFDEFYLLVSALSSTSLEKPEGLEDVFSFMDEKFNEYFIAHAELIIRGINEGVFRGDLEPDFHARSFYAYLWGVYLNRIRFFSSYDAEAMRMNCRDEIMLSYIKPEVRGCYGSKP